MLSPGFSIPSIGTPLHQMEADQQIVANPVYHPPTMQQHDINHSNALHSYNSHDLNQIMGTGASPAPSVSGSGMTPQNPSLPVAHKQMQSYQPSYTSSLSGTTPQALMQPQTPVNSLKNNILMNC